MGSQMLDGCALPVVVGQGEGIRKQLERRSCMTRELPGASSSDEPPYAVFTAWTQLRSPIEGSCRGCVTSPRAGRGCSILERCGDRLVRTSCCCSQMPRAMLGRRQRQAVVRPVRFVLDIEREPVGKGRVGSSARVDRGRVVDSGAKKRMGEERPPVLASDDPLLLRRLEAGRRKAEQFAGSRDGARDAGAHCDDQQPLARVRAEPLHAPQEGTLDTCRPKGAGHRALRHR